MSFAKFDKFLRGYSPMKKSKFKQTLHRRKQKRAWLATPRGKYWQQKTNAKRRGIAWEFTFETWWQLWEASGMWEQRGAAAGYYCLSRRGDAGAYSPDNCAVMLFEANATESNRNYVRNFGRTPTEPVDNSFAESPLF
jgi:hypothetical protein